MASPQRPDPRTLSDRLWRYIRRQLGVNQTIALLREIREEQQRLAAAAQPAHPDGPRHAQPERENGNTDSD